MASGRNSAKVVSTLQDVDDLVKLITGKRIKNLVARGLDLFGENAKAKIVREDRSDDPLDPYNILGVRRNASTIVIKASFRALAREYHPDTGSHPDTAAFQRAKEAFDSIMSQRSSGV